MPLQLENASQQQLQQWQAEVAAEYDAIVNKQLSLDLTRGKPSADQLALSDALDGILKGNYISDSGIDTRNYGNLEGLPEARAWGADLLGLETEEVYAGGNSSLTAMYQVMLTAHKFGLAGADSAWEKQGKVKFLCPVPGYDRHFSVCQQLGIEMITLPMTDTGPDMDAVESLVKSDKSIKGIWCVPKYSNPTGTVYSDETVERIAKLGLIAAEHFRVFWDNAYAVHHFGDAIEIANIMQLCKQHGTEDSVIQFASTSKINHPGAGVAFIGASKSNLKGFNDFLKNCAIGPDKVNHLRLLRLTPDMASLREHMKKHAALLKPRFSAVLDSLQKNFGDSDLGTWESPQGGYFVSFDTREDCAKETVRLAAEAGVKLTPAGATYPYGNDPKNRNIRIAPTVPSIENVKAAMEVFVVCVKLAALNKALA